VITNNSRQKERPRFVSERELEDMGVCSRRTLQGWRLRGRGPRYYKIPPRGMVRYELSEVLIWLAGQAVTPGG
jgi:hypothetical protein